MAIVSLINNFKTTARQLNFHIGNHRLFMKLPSISSSLKWLFPLIILQSCHTYIAMNYNFDWPKFKESKFNVNYRKLFLELIKYNCTKLMYKFKSILFFRKHIMRPSKIASEVYLYNFLISILLWGCIWLFLMLQALAPKLNLFTYMQMHA